MKLKIIASILILIIISLVFYFNKSEIKKPEGEQKTQPETEVDKNLEALENNDDVFKNALNLYAQKKIEGTDFSSGPCLGKIADNWVLDIVHDPKTIQDNEEINQCKEYLEAEVEHFIEFDPEGNLIRAQ